MSHFPRFALLAVLVAVLTGCALFPSEKDKTFRNSPAYKAGYSDGCAAATAAGSSYRDEPVRQEEMLHSNEAYRAGWNTGYSACRRMSAPGSELGHPIPEPSPGH